MKPCDLYIINDTERPCVYLLCRKITSKGSTIYRYLNRKLNNRHGRMTSGKGGATSLADFGFTLDETTGIYSLVNNSIAKYHDGKPRKWQDIEEFSINALRYRKEGGE